ncbi:MAG: hypothetical protein ACTSUE_07005 [Promethearchaeota archaeon]
MDVEHPNKIEPYRETQVHSEDEEEEEEEEEEKESRMVVEDDDDGDDGDDDDPTKPKVLDFTDSSLFDGEFGLVKALRTLHTSDFSVFKLQAIKELWKAQWTKDMANLPWQAGIIAVPPLVKEIYCIDKDVNALLSIHVIMCLKAIKHYCTLHINGLVNDQKEMVAKKKTTRKGIKTGKLTDEEIELMKEDYEEETERHRERDEKKKEAGYQGAVNSMVTTWVFIKKWKSENWENRHQVPPQLYTDLLEYSWDYVKWVFDEKVGRAIRTGERVIPHSKDEDMLQVHSQGMVALIQAYETLIFSFSYLKRRFNKYVLDEFADDNVDDSIEDQITTLTFTDEFIDVLAAKVGYRSRMTSTINYDQPGFDEIHTGKNTENQEKERIRFAQMQFDAASFNVVWSKFTRVIRREERKLAKKEGKPRLGAHLALVNEIHNAPENVELKNPDEVIMNDMDRELFRKNPRKRGLDD